ncbi:MAG: DUF5060 domain-containing protein [Kiritimatiellae bacterium]|nr:DUF5060 domain-containing protein [Kiritimatiellia bacterium]
MCSAPRRDEACRRIPDTLPYWRRCVLGTALACATVARAVDVPLERGDLPAYKAERGLVMNKPLRMGPLAVNAKELKCGEKFEITFALDATYNNPFDPREIAVDGVFVGSDGKRIDVPGFFYSPFTTNEDGTETEVLRPEWKVRFTPRRPGTYAWQVTARDRAGAVQSAKGSLRCMPGQYNGFCRVAANRAAFEHDNGTPYHAIGINLLGGGWVKVNEALPAKLAYGKIHKLNTLAEFGGTFARFRLEGGYHPVERPLDLKAGFLGPGWYHQRVCHGADRVFDCATQLNIQLMLCIYEGIVIGGGGGKWYQMTNWSVKSNGGPCESGSEFWTNEEARRLVRQKLRYLVARWGCSPNLFAWEFFNEIGGPMPKIAAWHRDMARYLRSIDPYAHPVSTSSHTEDESLWGAPELDFAQQHVYGRLDVAQTMHDYAEWAREKLGKPVLFGEFGPPGGAWDAEGVSVHNAIWGGALGGGCGEADWYLDYLRKNDLYRHYKTFADWQAGVPWNHPRMQPLSITNVVTAPARTDGPPAYQDLVFHGGSNRRDGFEKAAVARFPIDPKTREVGDIEHLQPYLHGMPARKTKPVFVLDCGAPAKFQVLVTGSVGDSSNALKIYLDGKLARNAPFPAAKGEGKDAKGPDKWNNWTVSYEKPQVVSVDVPPGKHEVMVEAIGKDRLNVSYRISRYAIGLSPSRVLGRQTGDGAWLWIQSMSSRAADVIAGIQDAVPRKMRGTLTGLSDGEYQIEWYDCWQGKPLDSTQARCTSGRLPIESPPFVRDVAVKVCRPPR